MMGLSVLILMLHLCWPALGFSPPVIMAGCTDPNLLKTAERALYEVNENRREGYIWKLNRLYDFSEKAEGKKGSSFKFYMDVVGTNCHVLSRKPCGRIFIPHVHGQCEVSVFQNKELFNHITLQAYHCVIKKEELHSMFGPCPDCPRDIDLKSHGNMEKLKRTLQEFNSNGGWLKYFVLLNVISAQAQFVFGNAYYFEYTIQETVCTKCMTDVDLNQCKIEKFPRVGICRTSQYADVKEVKLGSKVITLHPVIDVDCEIIEPKYAKKDPLLGSVIVLPSSATLPRRPPPKGVACPGDSTHPFPLHTQDKGLNAEDFGEDFPLNH